MPGALVDRWPLNEPIQGISAWFLIQGLTLTDFMRVCSLLAVSGEIHNHVMWEVWYLLFHAFESNRIAVPREKSLFGSLQVRFMCRRHLRNESSKEIHSWQSWKRIHCSKLSSIRIPDSDGEKNLVEDFDSVLTSGDWTQSPRKTVTPCRWLTRYYNEQARRRSIRSLISSKASTGFVWHQERRTLLHFVRDVDPLSTRWHHLVWRTDRRPSRDSWMMFFENA